MLGSPVENQGLVQLISMALSSHNLPLSLKLESTGWAGTEITPPQNRRKESNHVRRTCHQTYRGGLTKDFWSLILEMVLTPPDTYVPRAFNYWRNSHFIAESSNALQGLLDRYFFEEACSAKRDGGQTPSQFTGQ